MAIFRLKLVPGLGWRKQLVGLPPINAIQQCRILTRTTLHRHGQSTAIFALYYTHRFVAIPIL